MNCMRLWIIKQSKNIQLEIRRICEFHCFVHHQQVGEIEHTNFFLWIVNLKVQLAWFWSHKKIERQKERSTSWIVPKSSSTWLIKRSCESKNKNFNYESRSKLDYYSKLKNWDFGCGHQNQMKFMANLHPSLLSFTHLMNSLDHVWHWWEIEILFQTCKGIQYANGDWQVLWCLWRKTWPQFSQVKLAWKPLIISSIIRTWQQLALLSW